MGLWDTFQTGQGLYGKAGENRFLRFGWITAWLYFLIAAATIYGFSKRISIIMADPTLKGLSVGYVVFMALFTAGYGMRKASLLIPILVFQAATFVWVFIKSRQTLDSEVSEVFTQQVSPYFTGLFFGVAAYVYLRKRYSKPEM